MLIPLLSTALLASLGAFARQEAFEPPTLVPAVTAGELEAHVRTLASDALGGRDTATPGTRLAADYLADVLEQAGVEPAGTGGTYYQVVPLERVTPERPARLVLTFTDGSSHELVDGLEMLVRTRGPSTVELQVVVVREPDEVPDSSEDLALFLDTDRSTAAEWLTGVGAPDGRGFGLLLVPGRSSPGTRERRITGRGSLQRVVPGLPAPALVRINGEPLEALRSAGVLSALLDSGLARESLRCQNVVGRIPGRRPGETVVLSAHYDHLGRSEPPADAAPDEETTAEPDSTYNGADDDASGCAAVLEIAAALAAEAPLERTVVVLLATGEERGLLGTEHYLANPIVPLEDTLLNVNFEMVGRPDELVGAGRLWLTGWERSNLGSALSSAGVGIARDARPEEDFFRRSDNYAFARLGIVAQTLSSYGMHDDYHRVTDEWETLDYEHMETAVGIGLEAVRAVVYGRVDPKWLPGGNPAED